MVHFGRLLVLVGAVIFFVGLLLTLAPKIPYLGKLPGDVHIKKDNFDIYIPIATSLIISFVLSAILWIINYFSRK